MADEGVETATDALRLIEAGAMDAVSIKLWKMGGYYKSREIAAVCNAANVGVHVGSTAGSQLMEAMQLHFCAAIPELFAGAEIGEFESLNDDPGIRAQRQRRQAQRLRSSGSGCRHRHEQAARNDGVLAGEVRRFGFSRKDAKTRRSGRFMNRP